jgi:hypothetical protein
MRTRVAGQRRCQEDINLKTCRLPVTYIPRPTVRECHDEVGRPVFIGRRLDCPSSRAYGIIAGG